jgi:hypothetical protein
MYQIESIGVERKRVVKIDDRRGYEDQPETLSESGPSARIPSKLPSDLPASSQTVWSGILWIFLILIGDWLLGLTFFPPRDKEKNKEL